MKRVLSVSIGSSTRDHRVETRILNEDYVIERKGTDGDIDKAVQMIREFDGKVDAFGMGGIDLYIYGGGKRYIIKDAVRLKEAAKISPMVDGSGLKNTLERKTVQYITDNNIINLAGKKVLMVSAMDRFGMSEALIEAGAKVICGDMIFALGIPKKINSIHTLHRIARIIAPVACRLPFEILYPTGKKQETKNNKFHNYYYEADIIAGDFLYINKYMPDSLAGKNIITNTVTAKDIERLRNCGISTLITTTPEYEGRSFGTNVMEAIIVAEAGKGHTELKPVEYEYYLDKLGFNPRVVHFNTSKELAGGNK